MMDEIGSKMNKKVGKKRQYGGWKARRESERGWRCKWMLK